MGMVEGVVGHIIAELKKSFGWVGRNGRPRNISIERTMEMRFGIGTPPAFNWEEIADFHG